MSGKTRFSTFLWSFHIGVPVFMVSTFHFLPTMFDKLPQIITNERKLWHRALSLSHKHMSVGGDTCALVAVGGEWTEIPTIVVELIFIHAIHACMREQKKEEV